MTVAKLTGDAAADEEMCELAVLENIKAAADMGRLKSLTMEDLNIDCPVQEAIVEEIVTTMKEKGLSFTLVDHEVEAACVSLHVMSFCLPCSQMSSHAALCLFVRSKRNLL